jgi:hypothetical protein
MRPQSWGNGPLLLVRFVFRRIHDLRPFGKLRAKLWAALFRRFAAAKMTRWNPELTLDPTSVDFAGWMPRDCGNEWRRVPTD